MSFAAVVLAHRAPDQVARLVARLAPNRVFLHIDAAVPHEAAQAFAASAEAGAALLPRHRSGWASWGIVAAILEGMAAATLADDWSHLVVLSGQDYPLCSAQQIAAFLDDHPDRSFMAHWPLPSRLWGADGGMHRLRFRHRPVRGRRVYVPIPRRLPHGVTPFGGSMYACLSRAAVDAVLSFAAARPDVVRFYRRSWIPDEMFIPTAVMNSAVGDTVVNESLSFIRWSDSGGPHPDLLRTRDFEMLAAVAGRASDVGGYGRRKLFARKFDGAIDADVLDLVDDRLLSVRGPVTDR